MLGIQDLFTAGIGLFIDRHVGLNVGLTVAHGDHDHAGVFRPDGRPTAAAFAVLVENGVIGHQNDGGAILFGLDLGKTAVVGIGCDGDNTGGAVDGNDGVFHIGQSHAGVGDGVAQRQEVAEHAQAVGVANAHIQPALGVDRQIQVGLVLEILLKVGIDGFLGEVITADKQHFLGDLIDTAGRKAVVKIPVGDALGMPDPQEALSLTGGDGREHIGQAAVLQGVFLQGLIEIVLEIAVELARGDDRAGRGDDSNAFVCQRLLRHTLHRDGLLSGDVGDGVHIAGGGHFRTVDQNFEVVTLFVFAVDGDLEGELPALNDRRLGIVSRDGIANSLGRQFHFKGGTQGGRAVVHRQVDRPLGVGIEGRNTANGGDVNRSLTVLQLNGSVTLNRGLSQTRSRKSGGDLRIGIGVLSQDHIQHKGIAFGRPVGLVKGAVGAAEHQFGNIAPGGVAVGGQLDLCAEGDGIFLLLFHRHNTFHGDRQMTGNRFHPITAIAASDLGVIYLYHHIGAVIAFADRYGEGVIFSLGDRGFTTYGVSLPFGQGHGVGRGFRLGLCAAGDDDLGTSG